MTVHVSPDDRASILGHASHLLSRDDRADPVRVAAAAIPLLEWAEAAADEDDLRYRMRAMARQHINSADAPRDPARFVDDAGTLYAFLCAGRKD
jgi:hypothetical protein